MLIGIVKRKTVGGFIPNVASNGGERQSGNSQPPLASLVSTPPCRSRHAVSPRRPIWRAFLVWQVLRELHRRWSAEQPWLVHTLSRTVTQS